MKKDDITGLAIATVFIAILFSAFLIITANLDKLH
jgi:hypothetical protein